nr:uncharacterized protein CTRU02_03361 [Colletotrichum truncatum]KAF6797330.1 hypothetical protein CTRU02_03361 [Colletotrichum truncatum]
MIGCIEVKWVHLTMEFLIVQKSDIIPSYKDSNQDDYKTYKEGLLQGGKNHRIEDLPPFEFNETAVLERVEPQEPHQEAQARQGPGQG